MSEASDRVLHTQGGLKVRDLLILEVVLLLLVHYMACKSRTSSPHLLRVSLSGACALYRSLRPRLQLRFAHMSRFQRFS